MTTVSRIGVPLLFWPDDVKLSIFEFWTVEWTKHNIAICKLKFLETVMDILTFYRPMS